MILELAAGSHFRMADDCNRCFATVGRKAGIADLFARSAETSFPNSAQTESVAAGAMGIQLGGTHVYFGKVVEKPTIGDAIRHAQPTDILTANKLLFGSSLLFAGLVGGLLLWLSLR